MATPKETTKKVTGTVNTSTGAIAPKNPVPDYSSYALGTAESPYVQDASKYSYNAKSQNDAAMARAAGQTVYDGYDAFGNYHWSTKSQDRVNGYINKWNDNLSGGGVYNANDGYTYSTKPQFDESGKLVGYTTSRQPTETEQQSDYWEALTKQMQENQAQQAEMLQKMYDDQQASIRANTQSTIDSINSNKVGIENDYQSAQRQAYINSVLQQNQMDDYLSAMGYSGGMSESTLAGIANNYDNNRLSATASRDEALRKVEQLVAEAQRTGNTDLANAMTNYYQQYMSQLQNQQQMDYNMAQAQLAQNNANRDYDLSKSQLDLQNKQFDFEKKQYKDEQALNKETAKKTEAADKAANLYSAFLNTFEGKITSKAYGEKWIKNLEDTIKTKGDPYGYRRSEINYIKAYIRQNF